MLFQFMASAYFYFPLTREQPEIHLLQNRRQRTLGGPERGGGSSACRPSQISFLLPAQLGTRTAVSHVFEPQQLSSDTKGGFHAAWCCLCLQSLAGLTGCMVNFVPTLDFSKRLVQGGEGELCWGQRFSLPPSLTSLEWCSWCCHGNGACSHRRGNVCGIQLLPGVGRREPAFYPVQVPTAGRDVRFKMGGRGGEQIRL